MNLKKSFESGVQLVDVVIPTATNITRLTPYEVWLLQFVDADAYFYASTAVDVSHLNSLWKYHRWTVIGNIDLPVEVVFPVFSTMYPQLQYVYIDPQTAANAIADTPMFNLPGSTQILQKRITDAPTYAPEPDRVHGLPLFAKIEKFPAEEPESESESEPDDEVVTADTRAALFQVAICQNAVSTAYDNDSRQYHETRLNESIERAQGLLQRVDEPWARKKIAELSKIKPVEIIAGTVSAVPVVLESSSTVPQTDPQIVEESPLRPYKSILPLLWVVILMLLMLVTRAIRASRTVSARNFDSKSARQAHFRELLLDPESYAGEVDLDTVF